MRLFFITLLCGTLGILSPGGVADAAPVESADSEREPFAKGTRATGVGVGAAWGTLGLGGTVRHDWGVAQVQYGVVVSDPLGEGRWINGRLYLGGEFLFGRQYEPDSGVLFGFTPMIRYLFETSGRWKPFVEGGAGAALTDIGGPSLGGTLQFSPQIGAGFFWMMTSDLAVGFQQRFIHYSNGSLQSPNVGLNQNVSVLSLVRFF